MIIHKLETYRDGGTIKVDTDKGVFYIDFNDAMSAIVDGK